MSQTLCRFLKFTLQQLVYGEKDHIEPKFGSGHGKDTNITIKQISQSISHPNPRDKQGTKCIIHDLTVPQAIDPIGTVGTSEYSRIRSIYQKF